MGRGPSYPLERIEEGLVALVLSAGNATEAGRQTGIPRRTIEDWRKRYPDRFHTLSERYGREIEQRIAQRARELATRAGEVELLALKRAEEQLERDEDKQPAMTLQRLATSKGINVDKALVLEGRPNQITSHESPGEILKALREHMRRAGAIRDESIQVEVMGESGEVELPG